MLKEKSITRRINKIIASSSSSTSDDHKSLGADQEHAAKTQASTLDIGSSSAIATTSSEILSQQDPFI